MSAEAEGAPLAVPARKCEWFSFPARESRPKPQNDHVSGLAAPVPRTESAIPPLSPTPTPAENPYNASASAKV